MPALLDLVPPPAEGLLLGSLADFGLVIETTVGRILVVPESIPISGDLNTDGVPPWQPVVVHFKSDGSVRNVRAEQDRRTILPPRPSRIGLASIFDTLEADVY